MKNPLISAVLIFPILFFSNAYAIHDSIADSGYVNTYDGEKLFYKTIGEGEPIIVIHGGPGWYSEFDFDGLKALGEEYKVIFFDQRGSGKSKAKIDSTTINLDVFHKDINSLLQHFDYERANFLGISFGAIIGTTYGIQQPQRIQKLILLAPTGLDASNSQAINSSLQQRLGQDDMAEFQAVASNEDWADSPAKQASERFRIMFRGYTEDLEWLKSLDFKMNDYTAKSQQQVTGLMMTSLGNFDFYNDLKKIDHIPTLILRGDYDPIPSSYVERIHQNLQKSEMIEMKGIGHFPHYEAPKQTIDAISDFLSSK